MPVINCTQVIFDCSCKGQITHKPFAKGGGKFHYLSFELTSLWKQGLSYSKPLGLIKRPQTSDDVAVYQMLPWNCKWARGGGRIYFP